MFTWKLVKEIESQNSTLKKVLSCELNESITFYNNTVGDLMDLFLFAVIPFIVMTVCSIRLSLILFETKKKIYSKKFSGKGVKIKKEFQFVFTIILINLVFLIFNIPICILLLVRNLSDDLSYTDLTIFNLLYTVSSMLSYFNFSNSLMIHLYFNRLFRIKFLKLFKLI